MEALRTAVFALLQAALPTQGQVWHVQAPKDWPYPFVTYRVGSAVAGTHTNFSQEFRECMVRVEAVSDDPDWVAATFQQLDDLLTYAALTVEGWTQAGRVTFQSMLPDPGDTTPDTRIVYREGALYNVALQRQRTDI